MTKRQRQQTKEEGGQVVTPDMKSAIVIDGIAVQFDPQHHFQQQNDNLDEVY